MKIFLKQINVLSKTSEHHLTKKDIFINNGRIESISGSINIIPQDSIIIDDRELWVSPGWFDLHANFREPGDEIKENLQSGSLAAANGGFTGVLLMPSTTPPITSKAAVEFILSRSTTSTELFPSACISENRAGENLSEMFDLSSSGVTVFTDDKNPVHDSGLMLRALLYVKNCNGKIFSFAEEKNLGSNGIVNEGLIATTLGLKGIPSLAEEIMIARDIALVEYSNSSIHFSTISTKRSVGLIREAKKKGLRITADVSVMHLYFNDEAVESFDSNFKIKPPLRNESDRQALIEGLADGTIDCICSDHSPENPENKIKEFYLAAFGVSAIDTAFAASRSATTGQLSIEELILKLTDNPRRIAGLNCPEIKNGSEANLTLFYPDTEWNVEDQNIKSRSKNNPFIGRKLTGRPYATINKGKFTLCN